MNWKNICIVMGVVLIFIIAGIIAAVVSADNGGINFVRLEINPKVEFVVEKGKVTAFRPVNSEAEIVLAGESLIGLDFKGATNKYLDLCKQTGYLKVDGRDNVLKISCISGILQQDDVKVFRAAQKFFVSNEIMSVIIENDDDLQVLKAAKKSSSSADKEMLIKSILEMFPDKTPGELKKLKIKQLLKIAKSGMQTEPVSKELLSKKTELTAKYAAINKEHDAKITPKTTRKFAEQYAKFYKQNKTLYEKNFDTYYVKWKQRHSVD